MALIPFEQATSAVKGKKHLLLGNGFSIALKPDIFTYGSLLDNADFSKAPHLPLLFQLLETSDFEVVIRQLTNAAKIAEFYRGDEELKAELLRDSSIAKDALVSVIAKRHPDRPFDVADSQYVACRKFLSHFDHIFTLNYDVLLYWTLMQDEVDELKIRPDDGFRHPENDPDLPYVSWQQAQTATVHYLHGALHLFDRGAEITKYTWSKADRPIVEQIRQALMEDRFPLFVAEGTSDQKMEKILHNAYLHKALRSFEACCDPAANSIFVFGHSLAENDHHVLRCIAAGKASHLFVGVHGSPDSPANKSLVANAESIVASRERLRRGRSPLTMSFYDAGSARVWG
jgi:hypothetical protein